MAKLYITLHALSIWNELGKTQGHCDTPLSPTGKLMAERLAERTDISDLKMIFTSDLRRSRQTAEPLSRRRNLPIIEREDLREGNWKNHHLDPDLKPKPCSYGWETRDELAVRSRTAMLSLLDSLTVFPVLVVTHGAFLKTFLEFIDPDALDDYRSIRTALTTLNYENGKCSIVSLNDDSHLRGLQERSQASLDHG